jgi:hypothetical protein
MPLILAAVRLYAPSPVGPAPAAPGMRTERAVPWAWPTALRGGSGIGTNARDTMHRLKAHSVSACPTKRLGPEAILRDFCVSSRGYGSHEIEWAPFPLCTELYD